MRVKQKERVMIGVVTMILFITGSFLTMVHRADLSLSVFSQTNLLAIGAAGFLALSEVVFFWCHSCLVSAKGLWRKIVYVSCMASLAVTISLAIGSEWTSVSEEGTTKFFSKLVAQDKEQALAVATTRRERNTINDAARGQVDKLVTNMAKPNFVYFRVNFFAALLVIALITFCYETKNASRVYGQGNIINTKPALKTIAGFAPESEIRAYNTKGGYALWDKGRYAGFVSEKRAEVKTEEN